MVPSRKAARVRQVLDTLSRAQAREVSSREGPATVYMAGVVGAAASVAEADAGSFAGMPGAFIFEPMCRS